MSRTEEGADCGVSLSSVMGRARNPSQVNPRPVKRRKKVMRPSRTTATVERTTKGISGSPKKGEKTWTKAEKKSNSDCTVKPVRRGNKEAKVVDANQKVHEMITRAS